MPYFQFAQHNQQKYLYFHCY